MNLDSNNVHIWYISFNNKKLLNIDRLIQMLNENERIKSNSFVKPRDKRNYIISHAYLRILLTKYYPNVSPKSWMFSKNSYGKPFLSKVHNINVYFNMSHTYSTVAYVFTKSNICGIDIEEDRNIILDEQLINLVLSDKEVYVYQKSKNKNTLFYRFWTIKEAYLKACGVGLSQKIRQTNYSFIKNIDTESFITFNQEGYYYGTFFIKKTYLSYCLKSFHPLKVELHFL